MDKYAEITSAAHFAAGGINGGKPPTAEQARAGNFRKGRVCLNGLNVAIETPAGCPRTGKEDGKPWSVVLHAHYGELSGTKGADGDPIDVFIGPVPESERVWVVNRCKADGSFDEHKILMGFMSEEHAVNAYKGSYERGQSGLVNPPIPCTIEQLKWWLKYGNHAIALEPKHLPYDGNSTMTDITWDSAANPVQTTIHQLVYAMRKHEDADLLLDAVSVADILEDADTVLTLDALVIPYNRLELKMKQLQTIMKATGGSVVPVSYQITEPFKQRGTTQVAAVFELSDGQTVSIFFHNPDTTPNKITPDDEMVSWKWLLNKKDVTIVVAPERGQDLSPREVARRVMKLAEKNSARFQSANTARAERMATIDGLRKEVEEKQQRLDGLNAEIERLEAMPEPNTVIPEPVTFKEIARDAVPAEYKTRDSVGDEFLATNDNGIGVRLQLAGPKDKRFVGVYLVDDKGYDYIDRVDIGGGGLEEAVETAVKLFLDAMAESSRNSTPESEQEPTAAPAEPSPEFARFLDKNLMVTPFKLKGTTIVAVSRDLPHSDYFQVADTTTWLDGVYSAEKLVNAGAKVEDLVRVAEYQGKGRDSYTPLDLSFLNKNSDKSANGGAEVDPEPQTEPQSSASIADIVSKYVDKLSYVKNDVLRDTGDPVVLEVGDKAMLAAAMADAREKDAAYRAEEGVSIPDGDYEKGGAWHRAANKLMAMYGIGGGDIAHRVLMAAVARDSASEPDEPVAPEQVAAEAPPANGGAEVDPQVSADRAYLNSVIAGEIDLLHPEVGTKLEEIYSRAESDPDLMAQFEQAAQAYSEFVVAKAKSVL